MDLLRKEISNNFNRFSEKWFSELGSIHGKLSESSDKFLQSYERIVSLNSWRVDFLTSQISSESLDFFLEAQNDVLTSHIFARLGSWRSALKSLRSCLENTFYCLYYKDHPVEFNLWENGKHKLNFTELLKYFSAHPDIVSVNDTSISGLQLIKEEYGLLSKAVHGSAKSFRMTGEGKSTLFWSASKDKLGAWSTRESHTLFGLNLILTTLFRTHLTGTNFSGLRKAISFSIPKKRHPDVKKHLGVRLYTYS